MARVAVIGLGRMGRGIAKRLLARSHEVYGYDVAPKAYEQLQGAPGFHRLSNPSEAVGESDYVLLVLPDGASVMNTLVFLKDYNGVVVNMTTVGLSEQARIESMARDLRINILSAMIEGGPANAEAGTLVFYVGGPRELYERSAGLLSDMGSHVYLGDHRTAVAMKLLSTLILMSNTVVLAEAAQALRSLGLDAETVVKALSMGGADSAQLRSRLPLMLSGQYKDLFSIDLAVYVAKEAVNAIKELGGTITPVLSEVVEVLSAARKLGLGAHDIAEVFEMYRRLAG